MTTATFVGLLMGVTILGGCAAPTAPAAPRGAWKKIALSPAAEYQPLLTGPPQTGGMRSGRVVLKAGEEMHRHSTEGNEELLVFLRGEARVLLEQESVTARAGEVLYIPPHTAHEVHNDGTEELAYIYTVAPAR
jgi:mannose-6-phosphate isomerase-like protein (cupin superfamily)